MEFTAQNIEYAVSVFYNGEPTDRAKAHTWLTTAQRVPEAWTFVWELLQPTKATEIQFFAATTLHTKILRCWNEVPSESYDQLRDKLLHAVFTYSKGPKIVTNRLCISLAAFILQQGTVDLVTILTPLSNIENTTLLLEVLTVIPEEYNSMTMGSALRSKNRAMLRQTCPAVLDDMLRHLQTVYNDYSNEPPSEQTILSWTTAATCASSWLTVDGEDNDFAPPLPERLPLFKALLTAVHVLFTCNEVVSDSALDACEACMSAARAAGGCGHSERYPNAAMEMLTCLAALVGPIMAKDNVPNSVNEELLSSLIMCCVALGESHTRTIVKAIDNGDECAAGARQIIDILLDAQATPGRYPTHETRSNLVFGFWYTLQDEIVNMSEIKRDEERTNVWRQLYSRLLTILIQKSEAVQDSMLSKDDQELLRCYRQDIADTVMYCYTLAGAWCWSAVEVAASSGGAARREAALHVLLALSDAEPQEAVVPALLTMLRHAVHIVEHPDSPTELHTALLCLGAYASWLPTVERATAAEGAAGCEGGEGAALARACVAAAGGALCREAAAAPPAALALRKLCEECPAPAAPLAPNIVRTALNSSQHDVWTRRQLMSAAGAVLTAAELEVAEPLLRDLAASLHADLTLQGMDPRSGGGAAECAAALITALSPQPHLAVELFRALAPTLPPHAVNPALVEPMFNILKQTVSELVDECYPLLGDIAELTVTAFNHNPSASGLDVLKLMVILFGKEWPECRNILRVGLETSARKVAVDPPASNDIAEALFCVLSAITRKRPDYLEWIEDLLPDLVELGSRCLRMWDAGAGRAACGWVSALAAVRPAVLVPYVTTIITGTIRYIGGGTTRSQIEPLSQLLLALNRVDWRRDAGVDGASGVDGADGGCVGLAVWLRQVLATPDFPTPHATDIYKNKFIAAVVKEKSVKRKIVEAVQEFSLVCRGLVGTEYARQRIASRQLIA